MKKYIISTISSAIIVPGLGQVLNGQIKKGLIHMGIIFVITVIAVIKLYQIITGILPGLDPYEINMEIINNRIDILDILIIKVIISAFLIIWIYSIIDAFIYGIKAEKGRGFHS